MLTFVLLFIQSILFNSNSYNILIKAVFFDLDGTLISFETHQILRSAKNAIRQLRERGIKVFVATGRHKSTKDDLKDLEFDGYVTLNGSVCLLGDETIYKEQIPRQDIHVLVDYLQRVESFPCVFVEEDFRSLNYRNEATDEIFSLLNYPETPVCNIDQIEDNPIYQVLAFFEERQEERIMRMLPSCKTTRWNPIFTDIVPASSDKWVGITKMLDHYHILPEETMTFGDGGNDISMLQHAGIGIAMGNAADEVKANADYVTDTVENDGVWKAIVHFGLLNG